MTAARPLARPGSVPSRRLRVVGGSRRRLSVGPWLGFVLLLVVAMFAMVIARTRLDTGAFELADINQKIAEAETRYQSLDIEVATLSSPARIGPLAEQMGMVYPTERSTLLVSGVVDPSKPSVDTLVSNGALALGSQP